MSWWQALILGIVEGLTEYLPISSTGHLILAAWLLGLADDQAQGQAIFTFNIVIQAGAIAAVAGLFWSRIKQMLLGLLGKDTAGLTLLIKLSIAFLPAAVLGPALSDLIQSHLNSPWPVVGALFVGAWLMLAVAFWRNRHPKQMGSDIDQVTWTMALLIGISQCIAMWPGTSRSMMTIVAGMLVGLRPKAAAEFSFLLGLITLSAATAYEALNKGQQMREQFSDSDTAILIGFISATVSAALAIKWFVAVLTRWGLGPFGWYRLGIALILAALLMSGWLSVPG